MAATICTFTGKTVDLENPTVEMIDIRDIAHALGNINRFTGHTKRPYSVAEHCIIGSLQPGMEEVALDFLLHDATEAYVGDVAKPLKGLLGDTYAVIEARFAAVIAAKFGTTVDADTVKVMDGVMLAVELEVLMRPAEGVEPSDPAIMTDERLARIGDAIRSEEFAGRGAAGFLLRFHELCAERYLAEQG